MKPSLSTKTRFFARNKKTSWHGHVQVFATKPGLIKTEEDIKEIIIKGVGTDYDWQFFWQNTLKKAPCLQLMIHQGPMTSSFQEHLCNLLKLSLHDKVVVYFIQGGKLAPRFRQLSICGIYNTSLVEFDENFIIGDIKQVQRLNDWGQGQVSGFEILIDDFGKLDGNGSWL